MPQEWTPPDYSIVDDATHKEKKKEKSKSIPITEPIKKPGILSLQDYLNTFKALPSTGPKSIGLGRVDEMMFNTEPIDTAITDNEKLVGEALANKTGSFWPTAIGSALYNTAALIPKTIADTVADPTSVSLGMLSSLRSRLPQIAEEAAAPMIARELPEENTIANNYLKAIEEGKIKPNTRLADFVKEEKGWVPPEYASKVDIKTPEEAFVASGDKVSEIIPEAKFNSWQKDPTHLEGGYPLYDIQTETGPTTVSKQTLVDKGIPIPETPPIPEVKPLPPPVRDFLEKSGVPPEEINTYSIEQAVAKMQELRSGAITDEAGRTIAPPQVEVPPKLPVDARQDVITSQYSEPPITAPIDNPNAPTDSVNRLKNALQSGKIARKAQDTLYSAERSHRAGMIAGVKTPGVEGYYQKLGMLKGDLPKIPTEVLLTQEDVNSLIGDIRSRGLLPYQEMNAETALVKLLSGKAPQPSEAKLLGNIFGPDMEELIHLHGGIGGTSPSRKLINEIVSLPKTLMSTADLSAPLRQGLPFIHKKEYWNSFSDMFKHVGSEKFFNEAQELLHERPNFDLGNDAGLYLADIGENISHREEQFLSKLIDKVPIIGHAKKASERAYVGFLNKLRADVFDNMVADAVRMGHNPEEAARKIAKFINTSTGRGGLGRLEKVAVELNAGLFSPRLISSRLTMLGNPKYYMDLPKGQRLEGLKALFSVLGAGTSLATLAKLAGADVSLDPNSSDFGKIKIGRTRLDPYGGFQQYVVAASRLLSGMTTSTSGKSYKLGTGVIPSKLGITLGIGNKYNPSFLENKLSPVFSFADDLLSAREFPPGGLGGAYSNYISSGNKGKTSSFPSANFNLKPSSRTTAEIINRFTPMIVNDLIDLAKEDPKLLPLGIPAAFGMGIQTMEPKKESSPFRINLR